MATPFDHYPYTNFHELNLAYFIVHFREIFAQWDQLYSDMLDWKNATDEELDEWKAGVLSDIDAWETALNTSLDAWKADTETDITGWMNDVIDALNAWKAAFQTLFDTTFSNLSDIKTDAEAARDAAIAAQTAAEAAAASVTASAAQIATNAANINVLQQALSTEMYLIDSTFTQGIAAYNSDRNKVEVDPGSTSWKYTVVDVIPGFAYAVKIGLYNNVHYGLLFTDDQNIVIDKFEQADAGSTKSVVAFYIAPSGATKLYVNSYIAVEANPQTYYYTSTESLTKDIDSLKDTSSDLMNRTSRNTSASFTSGQWTINSNNVVVKGDSSAWMGSKLDVVPGYKYNVITTIYSNVYYGLIFTDYNNKVIENYELAPRQEQKQIDVTYTAPAGSSYLYVNYRINETFTDPAVIEIFALTAVNNDNRPFTIASVNCGTFNHYRPDDINHLTPEEYLHNWRLTINDSDFDLFELVDCPFNNVSTPYTENDMFNNNVRDRFNLSGATDQFLESRKRISDVNILQVTQSVTVDDVTYTNTNRCKFLRTVMMIGDSKIAVYAIHASPQLSSGYEYLRAAQFADLLTDAANYDGFVAAGDFNCQTAQEYEIFTNAGCNMANCSYLGTYNTLRDIPADNIITSSNIIIRKFKVLDDYLLNSDHLPILAILEYLV